LQKVFANFDTSGKVTAVTFDEELKSSIATLARAVSNGKQLSSNSKNHSYGDVASHGLVLQCPLKLHGLPGRGLEPRL
jgi:hypothetical protein